MAVFVPAMAPDYRLGLGASIASGISSGLRGGLASGLQGVRQGEEDRWLREQRLRQQAAQDAALVPSLASGLGSAVGGGARGRSGPGGGAGVDVGGIGGLAEADDAEGRRAAVLARVSGQEADLSAARAAEEEAALGRESSARATQIRDIEAELMASDYEAEVLGAPRPGIEAAGQRMALADRGMAQLDDRFPAPGADEVMAMWDRANEMAKDQIQRGGLDPSSLPTLRADTLAAMLENRNDQKRVAAGLLDQARGGVPAPFQEPNDLSRGSGALRQSIDESGPDAFNEDVEGRAEEIYRERGGDQPSLGTALARLREQQQAAQEVRASQGQARDAYVRARAGGADAEAVADLAAQAPTGFAQAFEQAQRAAGARKATEGQMENPALRAGLTADVVLDPKEVANAISLYQRGGDTSGFRMMGIQRPPKDLTAFAGDVRRYVQHLGRKAAAEAGDDGAPAFEDIAAALMADFGISEEDAATRAKVISADPNPSVAYARISKELAARAGDKRRLAEIEARTRGQKEVRGVPHQTLGDPRMLDIRGGDLAERRRHNREQEGIAKREARVRGAQAGVYGAPSRGEEREQFPQLTEAALAQEDAAVERPWGAEVRRLARALTEQAGGDPAAAVARLRAVPPPAPGEAAQKMDYLLEVLAAGAGK